MAKIEDSARLIWIEAFLAAAAYEKYTEAGAALKVAPTTIQRRVIDLEIWLHRILVTGDVPLFLTSDGEDFVPIAGRVIALVDEGGLKAEISKTRVLPNGTVTIEGVAITTAPALEIGRLLIDSRADLSSAKAPPPRVSGKDIDLSFLDEG